MERFLHPMLFLSQFIQSIPCNNKQPFLLLQNLSFSIHLTLVFHHTLALLAPILTLLILHPSNPRSYPYQASSGPLLPLQVPKSSGSQGGPPCLDFISFCQINSLISPATNRAARCLKTFSFVIERKNGKNPVPTTRDIR